MVPHLVLSLSPSPSRDSYPSQLESQAFYTNTCIHSLGLFMFLEEMIPGWQISQAEYVRDWIDREHVQKIAFLAEHSAKALPSPPLPVSGTIASLCIF